MGVVFAGADFSLSAQHHCRAPRHPCIPAGADLLRAASQHHKGLGLQVEARERWCSFLQLSVHRRDVLHNAWQSRYGDVDFQWTIDKRNYGKVHCPLLLLLSLHPVQGGTSQAWFNLSCELPVLLMHANRWLQVSQQGEFLPPHEEGCAEVWGGADLCTGVVVHLSGYPYPEPSLWVPWNLLSRGAGGGCWQVVPSLTSRDNKANCAQDSAFIFFMS